MSKFYLCTDIINSNTKRLETYYLAAEELESLLKYTSYCTDYNMLLNTLPDKVKEFIKINSSGLNNHSFYYKKTKKSDKINAIYKDDEDILYSNFDSLINTMFVNAIFITPSNVRENSYNKKIEEIYKLIASLITKKELKTTIDYNFKKKFDSDKNLDYRFLDKCELWQKIALTKTNSDLAIKYICRDTYKKFIFAKRLKEILGKRLISNYKIQKNKNILRNKLRRKKSDYEDINNRMIKTLSNNKENNEVIETITLKTNNEHYDPYEDSNVTLEDMLYRYEKLLEEDPNNYDLRLYIDAMKEKEYGKTS